MTPSNQIPVTGATPQILALVTLALQIEQQTFALWQSLSSATGLTRDQLVALTQSNAAETIAILDAADAADAQPLVTPKA